MVGAKFQTLKRACQVASPASVRHARQRALQLLGGSHRTRWIALLSVLVPLSFVLVQCGRAPSAGTLAANVQASSGDSFDDRFPKPQFRDRFPTASESLVQRTSLDAPPKRIEVYDNSHIMGAHALGGMIVAGPEGFEKGEYRKFIPLSRQ